MEPGWTQPTCCSKPLTVISSLRPMKIIENPTDSLEAKFQNSLPLKVQISLNFAGPPKTGCSDPHFPTASKAQCSDWWLKSTPPNSQASYPGPFMPHLCHICPICSSIFSWVFPPIHHVFSHVPVRSPSSSLKKRAPSRYAAAAHPPMRWRNKWPWPSGSWKSHVEMRRT